MKAGNFSNTLQGTSGYSLFLYLILHRIALQTAIQSRLTPLFFVNFLSEFMF